VLRAKIWKSLSCGGTPAGANYYCPNLNQAVWTENSSH